MTIIPDNCHNSLIDSDDAIQLSYSHILACFLPKEITVVNVHGFYSMTVSLGKYDFS